MDALVAYLDAMALGALTRAKNVGVMPAAATSGPVQSCADSFKKMVRWCPAIDSSTRSGSRECTDAAKLATLGATALPALDLAKLHTNAANCRRQLAACLRYGSKHSGVPDHGSTRAACVDQHKSRIAETKNASDPLVLNERAHIEQAATYYRQVKTYLATLADCETAIGDAHEKKARDQLAKFERERTVRTGDTAIPASIDCLDRQSAARFCLFSDDGPRIEQASGNTPSATADFLQRFGIPLAKTEGDCTAIPFRSPESTGAKVVGTAGHCIKNRHTKFFVFDTNGRGTWVPAICEVPTDVSTQDYALCTLEREIPTYPIYLATHDPARTDDHCTTTGWLMTCGVGFFSGLTNSEVSGLGFPVGQPLTYARGRTYFNATNAMVHHDMIMPRGTSGGPLVVTSHTEGASRKVVLAFQAWSFERVAAGRGNAIPAAFATPFAASTAAPSPDEVELLRVINRSLECLPQPRHTQPNRSGGGYKGVGSVAYRQLVRNGQNFSLLLTAARIIWTHNDKERIETDNTSTLSLSDISLIDLEQSKDRPMIRLQCRDDRRCVAHAHKTRCHVTWGGGSNVHKSCSDKPFGNELNIQYYPHSSTSLLIEACSAKAAADIKDALNVLGRKHQQ